MLIDFSNLFKSLKDGVIDLAKKDLSSYLESASKDGQAIVDELKDDLSTWTEQLAVGTLSKDDFAYNVLSQKEEVEMVALKQAGLAAVTADGFKDDVFNLITNAVFKLIP